MSRNQKSIVGGMAVLSLAGLICKVVGALYRIPLSYIIGEQGLATYQLVFPAYNLFLTISSAGLPVAISRMVSYSLAKDQPSRAKKVFRIALCALTALGLIAMMVMIVFRSGLAARTGDPASEPGFAVIAPSLLLVCTISAFRGFIQGQQDMAPTAVSQLIEQVGKVIICLPLAYIGMKVSVAYGAAGMLLGTSIAEAVALLYIFLVYLRRKKDFARIPEDASLAPADSRSLIKELAATSIPMTATACIVPLSGFIDSGMMLRRLTQYAGLDFSFAKSLYGCYSGYVLTLINVPTAIALALATSLVPSISAAYATGDHEQMKNQTAMGLRISFLIGLPCTVGMCLLSREILALIYHFSTEELLTRSAQLLNLSSMTVILFTLVQSTSGILHGLKKERLPMYTLIAGVAVKIALNYLLIGNPRLNMFGAPIASICCYTISMIPNLLFVLKYTGMKFDASAILWKPCLATAVMGVVLFACKRLLPSGRLITVLLVLIGIGVYFAAAMLVGALKKEDLAPILRKLRRR